MTVYALPKEPVEKAVQVLETIQALIDHPKSEHILEFLQGVLDNEKDDKFYTALATGFCETYPDDIITALAKDSEALKDAADNDAFMKALLELSEPVVCAILKDPALIEELAEEEVMIKAVEENRELDWIDTDVLLAEVLHRYHHHDSDIKQWISDVQLNRPQALLARK